MPQGRYASVVEKLKPDAAKAGEIVDLNGRVLGAMTASSISPSASTRASGSRAMASRSSCSSSMPTTRASSSARAKRCARRSIILRDVNWLAPAEGEVACAVKVRSTRPPVPARVTPASDGTAMVELLSPEEAVAPGQACVFYEENGPRVLGGGWIARAEPSRAAPAKSALFFLTRFHLKVF